MVITSPRCAQGIIKSLVDCKLDNSWREKPVFVVGEATSQILIKEFNINPIGADCGNALSLVPIILKCNVILQNNTLKRNIINNMLRLSFS